MTRQYLFRIVFSIAALAVLGAYVFGPETLAKRFDTMALGLLGLAALPWLGALVEEFKVGGVEAKLRAIQEEVAVAGDAATEAREVAEELAINRLIPQDFDPMLSTDFGLTERAPEPALPPERREDFFEIAPGPALDFADSFSTQTDRPEDQATPGAAKLQALEAAAKSYIETRAKMRSSAARTAKMTAIFGDMQNIAAQLGGDNTDMLLWLRSDDAGRQLAGVSWLRSYPAAVPPSTYVDVIERATQPFVQYWGLRTLSARLSAVGLEDVSIADRINLKEFESLMRAGTDRHAQIRRINRKLAGRTPAD